MSLIVGQKLNLEISDVAFGGEGIGRLENFVVFVPFVIAGEVVEVEITEVKERFARARLCKVLNPSPERVSPACPYFAECGGCQYQHIEYSAQLRIKGKQITDLFQRIGGFAGAQIDPVIGCPQPYEYRNRVMIRSQWNKPKQGLNIGFLRWQDRLVVDVERCPISEPAINEQLRLLRANPPPKGGIKVVLRIQPEGWEVPPDSFFQNNFHLLPGLVEVVRDRIKSSKVSHLLDLYCGVGFFSLEAADLVDSFVGVECDQRAIRAARLNAQARGCEQGEFIVGMAEAMLPGIMGRYPANKTAVLLDPPRTGCSASIIEGLRKERPAQVIYVSCHPATLARDLALLTADGSYELARVTPLDMFPQTQHVECVADLRALAPAPESLRPEGC
jgi:tRNA/tmRNA/rRNA uracil-C5-methylase (TrmA/RlmC/RlmD family)